MFIEVRKYGDARSRYQAVYCKNVQLLTGSTITAEAAAAPLICNICVTTCTRTAVMQCMQDTVSADNARSARCAFLTY
jgi:hypothetical protein